MPCHKTLLSEIHGRLLAWDPSWIHLWKAGTCDSAASQCLGSRVLWRLWLSMGKNKITLCPETLSSVSCRMSCVLTVPTSTLTKGWESSSKKQWAPAHCPAAQAWSRFCVTGFPCVQWPLPNIFWFVFFFKGTFKNLQREILLSFRKHGKKKFGTGYKILIRLWENMHIKGMHSWRYIYF